VCRVAEKRRVLRWRRREGTTRSKRLNIGDAGRGVLRKVAEAAIEGLRCDRRDRKGRGEGGSKKEAFHEMGGKSALR
jgi:hypothetical protein